RGIRPTSLHAWACPGHPTTSAAAMELWKSLLDLLQDTEASAVGARLQDLKRQNAALMSTPAPRHHQQLHRHRLRR
ncbi:hypothetical protein HPB47_002040, partial [Ixodes persulcatus]